jgi:hypothetical protein
MTGFLQCELFHPTNDRLQAKFIGGIENGGKKRLGSPVKKDWDNLYREHYKL